VNTLLDYPEIAAVSFVGSTAVARHIYSRASAEGEGIQTQCGTKNSIVVMPVDRY
jgi:malonate-semialdehyde dehydrogenase (acetylating) / methylmalonate-semialdehyde dehydrogenase